MFEGEGTQGRGGLEEFTGNNGGGRRSGRERGNTLSCVEKNTKGETRKVCQKGLIGCSEEVSVRKEGQLEFLKKEGR